MYDSIVQGFIDAMNPAAAKRREVQRRLWCQKQLVHAEAWDPETTQYKDLLVIKAGSWKPRSFFNVPLTKPANINIALPNYLVVSPNKRWAYAEKWCPAAYECPFMYGRKRGVYMFDAPVRIPALYERAKYREEEWNVSPWMSITPMEVLTLRSGTRRAKGCTIVAGLGLGHQLIDVSHRKQVSKIVLVEKDEDLVHWLLPRIREHMKNPVYPRFEVVIGDAYKVMPKMTADVALVDIFPGYGGNERDRDKLREACPNIGFVWGWGCGAYRSRG